MKILSDNEKLLNELKINLTDSNLDVTKKEMENVDLDRRHMGDMATYLEIYNNATSAIVNTGVILTPIVLFLKRKYPEFKAYIFTDTLEITAEEYLEMSDEARTAVEENFKVIIKKK